MLVEVVVSCWEVRRIWQMRQNFIAQFVQLLKRWLCSMQSGTVVEENRALSVDHCWLQVFQFLVCWGYFSDVMLSLGFRELEWIRWAAVHQTVAMTFLGVQIWLWEVLWSFFLVQPLSWSSPLSYTIFLSHVTVRSRSGLLLLHRVKHIKRMIFKNFVIFGELMWHQLIEVFHLSNLLQMLNDHRMVNIEFPGKFSCIAGQSVLMMALNCHQLLKASHYTLHLLCKTVWTTTALSIINSSWTKWVVDVASCLHCFTTRFELK